MTHASLLDIPLFLRRYLYPNAPAPIRRTGISQSHHSEGAFPPGLPLPPAGSASGSGGLSSGGGLPSGSLEASGEDEGSWDGSGEGSGEGSGDGSGEGAGEGSGEGAGVGVSGGAVAFSGCCGGGAEGAPAPAEPLSVASTVSQPKPGK